MIIIIIIKIIIIIVIIIIISIISLLYTHYFPNLFAISKSFEYYDSSCMRIWPKIGKGVICENMSMMA